MKKSHAHNDLSATHCPRCNGPLKERMVQAKERIPTCYKCYSFTEGQRGHTINTKARKDRIELGLSIKHFK